MKAAWTNLRTQFRREIIKCLDGKSGDDGPEDELSIIMQVLGSIFID